jgi:hypothetical protein
LARRHGDVHGVVEGLVDNVDGEREHRSDARHHAGGDVGQVVNAVGVQSDARSERSRDLVGERDSA